jgi:hypothetical protein
MPIFTLYTARRNAGLIAAGWAILLTLICLSATMADDGGSIDHAKWRIQGDGIGPVVLGRPLPKGLVTRELKERYVAGYHADFQPHEGFRLTDPPVTVMFDRGPFMRRSTKELADPNEKGLPSKMVQAAKQGALVHMIVIETPAVTTGAGVGVGTVLTSLKAAYPDIRLRSVPPTFGHDECVAAPGDLPAVHFHFRTCKAAIDGEGIVRIMLFNEAEGDNQ